MFFSVNQKYDYEDLLKLKRLNEAEKIRKNLENKLELVNSQISEIREEIVTKFEGKLTPEKKMHQTKRNIQIFYDQQANENAQNFVRRMNMLRKEREKKELQKHLHFESKINDALEKLIDQRKDDMERLKYEKEMRIYKKLQNIERKKKDVNIFQEENKQFIKELYKGRFYKFYGPKETNISKASDGLKNNSNEKYSNDISPLTAKKEELARMRNIEGSSNNIEKLPPIFFSPNEDNMFVSSKKVELQQKNKRFADISQLYSKNIFKKEKDFKIKEEKHDKKEDIVIQSNIQNVKDLKESISKKRAQKDEVKEKEIKTNENNMKKELPKINNEKHKRKEKKNVIHIKKKKELKKKTPQVSEGFEVTPWEKESKKKNKKIA